MWSLNRIPWTWWFFWRAITLFLWANKRKLFRNTLHITLAMVQNNQRMSQNNWYGEKIKNVAKMSSKISWRGQEKGFWPKCYSNSDVISLLKFDAPWNGLPNETQSHRPCLCLTCLLAGSKVLVYSHMQSQNISGFV